MSEPVIVPPTPTITQPSGPVDNSPGLEQVQKAFDRAYPDRAKDADPAAAGATATPQSPAPQPQPEPAPQPEPTPTEELKIPSFLEEALKVDSAPAQPETPQDPSEFPEELPPEERKSRIKGLRDAYKRLKGEVETLRTRPAQDEATTARLQQLETQNQEMTQVLTRMGVETHQDFQRNIIQPMTAVWQQAAGIVKDAGGDPSELARAVMLQGKAHFEALDEVFEGLPESAKLEAHQAIANYKRLDKVRQEALQNAPKTYEALHKKDLERQYQNVTEQRNEMKKLFLEAGRKLREVAKVEVLQKSEDPDAKWWNQQAEEIEQNASNLYMENTDMEKMAFATWLAPMADVYRKLWLSERMAHQKTAKNLKEHFGAEPYIGQSSGGENGPGTMEEDLKKPFSQVFLREFHKAQQRNR